MKEGIKMENAKSIEISVTEEDLRELIEYYKNKKSRNSSDRMMIAQLEIALEKFSTLDSRVIIKT